jgi:hypothetical protein
MKLKSPSHVTVGGKHYKRAKDGTVDVPAEHAPELIASHGCQGLEADQQGSADGKPSEPDDPLEAGAGEP